MIGVRPLSAAQAQSFLQAQKLLQAGQYPQALNIARTLVEQAPLAADAWQLLAICLTGNACEDRACEAFERALALLPGNATIERNYAALLAKQGKALRIQGKYLAAESVLRKSLDLFSDEASAWVDLGVVLRLLGRVDEALPALRRAEALLQRRGIFNPELQDAINGVLADSGSAIEAIGGARKLVKMAPGQVQAHETLSRMLWENGAALAPDEDPFDEFHAAARSQPENQELQFALARMLLSANRPEEVLRLLHPLRKRDPDNVLAEWFVADALEALRQHERAAQLYEAIASTELGQLPTFLNTWARHAFRTKRFDLAAACSERCVKIDPIDQQGWANLGTAWRLLGDEREHWLCDYDRLIGYVEITPPSGFDDLPAFLHELSPRLEAMHSASREPLNQSVRGGTQTGGRLFGRCDKIIRMAECALRVAVEDWMTGIPDDSSHPFLSRKRGSIDFVGSWSVRLMSAGHHSNHIHGEGWASSAFYVALPDCVDGSDDESRAGWIQFGQPIDDLGLDLPPRRVICPKPGYLALFPSYIWHGTIPFEDQGPRLTIAFDMQPKD